MLKTANNKISTVKDSFHKLCGLNNMENVLSRVYFQKQALCNRV